MLLVLACGLIEMTCYLKKRGKIINKKLSCSNMCVLQLLGLGGLRENNSGKK
jgi:hypothetical protein